MTLCVSASLRFRSRRERLGKIGEVRNRRDGRRGDAEAFSRARLPSLDGGARTLPDPFAVFAAPCSCLALYVTHLGNHDPLPRTAGLCQAEAAHHKMLGPPESGNPPLSAIPAAVCYNPAMRKILTLALVLLAPLCAQQKKVVTTGLGSALIPEFQKVAPNVTFVAGDVKNPANLAAQAADADAILGTINPELFRAAKKLQWVHIFSAGVERYRFAEFLNSDVTLTNARVIQGPEIADHAFAFLLALTRGLYRAIPDRPKEEWGRGGYSAIELRGKTAVVVGVGGIGQQISQRAWAFGMTVIGVDPKDYPLSPYVSRMVPPDRIDTVLPLADVVFISAPHTPESEGMIGPRQFEVMKKGAYFIAVSRGKLYHTDALVKALDEKRLAGAGLDVTNPEPLPKGHPLWKFENVIITPHVATVSDGIGGRQRELILDNVARFAKGEPLRNVVDKKKGY